MSSLGVTAIRSRIGQLAALTGAGRRPPHDFDRLLAAKTTAPPTTTPDSASGGSSAASAPAVAFDRAAIAHMTRSTTLGSMLGAGPVRHEVPPGHMQLPARANRWAFAIEAAAHRAGIDPRLLAAVTWAESGFDPDAVSRAGAIGLTQLMPATAAGLGVDPTDPIENLEGGARYLAWTIEEFGSVELGLAAYNAGPGAVRVAGGIPDIAETQAYVPKVLDYYRLLGGTT